MARRNLKYVHVDESRPSNKYEYYYVLQGHYGYGWEDLTAIGKETRIDVYDKDTGERIDSYSAWKAIRMDRKDYRENEGGSYRIIERREKKR